MIRLRQLALTVLLPYLICLASVYVSVGNVHEKLRDTSRNDTWTPVSCCIFNDATKLRGNAINFKRPQLNARCRPIVPFDRTTAHCVSAVSYCYFNATRLPVAFWNKRTPLCGSDITVRKKGVADGHAFELLYNRILTQNNLNKLHTLSAFSRQTM